MICYMLYVIIVYAYHIMSALCAPLGLREPLLGLGLSYYITVTICYTMAIYYELYNYDCNI